MTDQQMAESLRAKGWKVEEPWTKENCKHPGEYRIGSGGQAMNGSGFMNWSCRRCGHSESHSWVGEPGKNIFHQIGYN